MVLVQRQIARNFQTGRLEHISPVHFSNFYPQWGSVDPWWCYWLCTTSSCACHPTNTSPSMVHQDVATSCIPLDGFQTPLCLGEHFPLDRRGDTTFGSTDRTCGLILASKLTLSRHFVYLVHFQLKFTDFFKEHLFFFIEDGHQQP